MVIPGLIHGTSRSPFSELRIEFFGAGNISKAARHEDEAAGQQRGGMQLAAFIQETDVRPRTARRIINFRA
jgi:hypothetical protein